MVKTFPTVVDKPEIVEAIDEVNEELGFRDCMVEAGRLVYDAVIYCGDRKKIVKFFYPKYLKLIRTKLEEKGLDNTEFYKQLTEIISDIDEKYQRYKNP